MSGTYQFEPAISVGRLVVVISWSMMLMEFGGDVPRRLGAACLTGAVPLLLD